MADVPELDHAELRTLVRQRLAALSHWMVLLCDQECDRTPELLAAIDAAQPADGARVRIDLWALDLRAVDADTGTPADLGTVLFVSWPRPALAPETLHATLERLFGAGLPITQLLEARLIMPVARARLWRAGEQLHALQDWLFDEEDDA